MRIIERTPEVAERLRRLLVDDCGIREAEQWPDEEVFDRVERFVERTAELGRELGQQMRIFVEAAASVGRALGEAARRDLEELQGVERR